MKRILGLMLIFAFIIVFFSGCGDLVEGNLNDTDDIVENIVEENIIAEIEFNDELVQQLYSYIGRYLYPNDVELVYRKEKTTYDSLSNLLKQLIVFSVYKTEGATQAPNHLYANVDADFEVEEYCLYEYTCPVSLFETHLKSIFGSNATVEHETFYPAVSTVCQYLPEEECYFIYSFMGGGDMGIVNFSQFLNAEQSEDKEFIYIYDKYIYIPYEQDQPTISLAYSLGKNTFSTDILNPNSLDNYWPFETIVVGTAFTQVFKEEILPYIPTFCHTYKRAEDGSYYWLSSEVDNN